MNKTIWIIKGETGEYSDYSTWIVKAFDSNEKAQLFKDSLIKKMILLNCYGDMLAFDQYVNEDTATAMRLLDPKFQIDYNGTNYTMISLEVS